MRFAVLIGPAVAALVSCLSSAVLGGGGSRPDRRVKVPGRLWTCRLCWKPITIEARYIEDSAVHVYFRCPSCGHSFPIRDRDK